MLAWVFGVIRTLKVVTVVVTGMVHPVNERVLLPGLVIAVHWATLLALVISACPILLNAPAGPRVTVAAVTVSVPVLATRVKASRSVIAAPGAIVALPGSVPSAIVVVAPPPLTLKVATMAHI